MTTEEYIELFSPDLENESEIIGLAMSIEAQAFDLYTRAARKADALRNREILNKIADEEKYHLEQLGAPARHRYGDTSLPRLLLIGGGHAHMTILAHLGEILEKGHEVCVIQPSDHHYYSGMGPGMLSTLYTADSIRFNTRFVVERKGGPFCQGRKP